MKFKGKLNKNTKIKSKMIKISGFGNVGLKSDNFINIFSKKLKMLQGFILAG